MKGYYVMNSKDFYACLKDTKDEFVNSTLELMELPTERLFDDDIRIREFLDEKISSDSDKENLKFLLNNIATGIIHSILVAFDGGDRINDFFILDAIDKKTGESLPQHESLHENFIEYLGNVEK